VRKMKFGLSSYSLQEVLRSGEMTILDVIRWAADHGSEHIEIVPLDFSLNGNEALIKQICRTCEDTGIKISNYAIGANFVKESEESYEAEIDRVLQEVDIANQLGVKLMRHDVASRPLNETSNQHFEQDLPAITAACQRIADHAKKYGITTSVENHGYYIQASDRVLRLVDEVNRANFKTTLDVGNFLCVEEDPVSAVKKTIQYASMIHIKDFYYRPAVQNPGEGWFKTASANYLRGAIAGNGDVDIREIIKIIKNSAYDGFISVEFEGMEECKKGARISLENVKRIFSDAKAKGA
jgi:sugar phosphate isomerase/epimerase